MAGKGGQEALVSKGTRELLKLTIPPGDLRTSTGGQRDTASRENRIQKIVWKMPVVEC